MFPYDRMGNSGSGRGLGFGAGVLLAIVLMGQSDAMANMTITAPGIDITTMGTYAGVILVALAGIWLVRKFIKTTNRS